MNLLDENVRPDQALLLQRQGIKVRRITVEVAHPGIHDDNVIPLLHRLKNPTLFSHDEDYFKRHLVHAGYCLVWLNLFDGDAAQFVRRFLRHPAFSTSAKRMGVVARVTPGGVRYWRKGQTILQNLGWPT